MQPLETSSQSGILVVRLRGGLGNQMFQYACGRTLSRRSGRTLLLDDSLLQARVRATPRPYYLHAFDIKAHLAPFKELRLQYNIVLSLSQNKRGFHEEIFHSIPELPLVTLDGYWQSERYFESIKNLLQTEFVLKNESGPDDVLQKIKTANSVCVHVRRTDYLDTAISHMSALDVGYYQRAVAYMASHIKNPYFFVFSDDISWCRENLKLPQPHLFVQDLENSKDRTIDDFSLMINCRHFIVANSTYSWWAAWLGKSEDKFIIAPKDWFPGAAAASKDIIPTTWQTL